MQYAVETLDARNIGSSVGLNMGDGEMVFGTIAAITRDTKSREVTVDLDTIEEQVTLPFGYRLDVQLKADALYALHTKNGIADLARVVEGMAETLTQIAEIHGIQPNIPALRAV